MATIGSSVATLVDWSVLQDPKGNVPDVINLLSENDEFLQNFKFITANGPDYHQTTQVTGEPTVAFRAYNEGAAQSKASFANIQDQMGMLETFSEIDKGLVDRNGNGARFRMMMEKPFLESLRKKALSTLIYGDHTNDPESFDGLSVRFANLTTGLYDNSMISAGGSGSDNTSVWLLNVGERSVHGIIPNEPNVGLTMEDEGVQTIQTDTTGVGGARMKVYRTHWMWKLGLAVPDWRHVVRLCNIDVSALVANSTPYDLIIAMSRMIDRIPSFTGTSPMFLVNSTVASWMRVQALAKSSSAIAAQDALDQFGNPMRGTLKFLGIPVYRVDQILNTEATVAA